MTERRQEHVTFKKPHEETSTVHELKQHAICSVSSIVYCLLESLLGEHGCGDDEHVLGDQQAEQDTAYFIQLWTHSCFSGSAGSRSNVLPCFAFVHFPFAYSGSAHLTELDDITRNLLFCYAHTKQDSSGSNGDLSSFVQDILK